MSRLLICDSIHWKVSYSSQSELLRVEYPQLTPDLSMRILNCSELLIFDLRLQTKWPPVLHLNLGGLSRGVYWVLLRQRARDIRRAIVEI
jgi:hypothetical protein